MITNKLKLDLQQYHAVPIIDAVQGDVYSRTLELSLYDGDNPFRIPENPTILIRYKKPDNTGGEYNTLPDGRSAWSAVGNQLTVTLIPQMLTFPGDVSVSITLTANGAQLSTFPLRVHVYPRSQSSAADTAEYFNIAGFLAAPAAAEPGQYLMISEVSEDGRVTAVVAANGPTGGGDGAPSDWNAQEGQPGHVLNRTHWTEIGEETEILAETMLTAVSDNTFIITTPFSISVDGRYTVTLNGTEFTCTGQDGAFLDQPGLVFLVNDGADLYTGEGLVFAIMALPEASDGIYGMMEALMHDSTITISIRGKAVTVHPIDPKYLSAARMQKAITLNLDNSSSSINSSVAADMDTGELQSAITAIYLGEPHSVTIDRIAEHGTSENDITYTVYFSIIHDPQLGRHNIIHGEWNGTSISLHPIKWEFIRWMPYSYTDNDYLYGKLANHDDPGWHETASLKFSYIMLKSSTAGSSKIFKITVDDSGTLTATEQ